jgi:hypothetical protein
MKSKNQIDSLKLIAAVLVLVMAVAATIYVSFMMSPPDDPEPQPKTTTATFVQCWSGDTEIYSATVKPHIHRPAGVYFETDYGSVTITRNCVLTELIETKGEPK